jgi:hypothetical protein
MQLVTLDQIETDARLYADQRATSGASAQFIDQTEARRLINQHGRKLYDLCILARPEFYAIELRATLNDPTLGACVSGRRLFIPMPQCPPFYLLLGLEIVWTPTNIEPIEEIRAADSYRYESTGIWGQWESKGYVLGGALDGDGEGVYVAPGPPGLDGTTIRCRYVPAWQDLGAKNCKNCDNDSFNAVNGWDRLLAYSVAREMRGIMRAQEDPWLERAYAEEKDRIETMARERNAQEPLEIRDVEPRYGPRFRWPRLPGAP